MTLTSRPAAALRRLLVVTLVVALGGLVLGTRHQVSAEGSLQPVPRAVCGPGARPETGVQGRVPTADYTSGRAAQGYRCNTRQVSHVGRVGGFKVLRYTDAAGRTCAYYDSTLAFPRDVVTGLLTGTGNGVVVLDMTDPAHPRRTATLRTPAMVSPHESLLLNERRGLLAGVLGTALTAPGVLDVYDIRADCRRPVLRSSTLSGVLGHESGFSHDGRTFYTASTVATLAAVDLTNPSRPRTIFTRSGVNYHGLRLSADDRTLYAARIGTPSLTLLRDAGLTIIDVSDIQARRSQRTVPVLSQITWPEHSIPQVAEPFTRDGRHYVLEVDEFIDLFELKGLTDLVHAPVGAARIIDVEDPRHPVVVSRIRLAVHQPDARDGAQRRDPGASFPAQGYAAHYCSLPTTVDPKIAGCSMILSGLRLFDIRDVRHPKEVGYFNQPAPTSGIGVLPTFSGGYAMSAPAWDRARGQVWYTDVNSGFYAVQLTNGVQRLLR